jgi:isopropylmalate/homocitrate/citramalate synthase
MTNPTQSGSSIPSDLRLVDVTLREGQQTSQVAFDADDERAIAVELAKAGVSVIQTGYAGDDDASLRRIREALPETNLSVLLVGWQPEALDRLASAADNGADVLVILFRSTDQHIANLGFSRQEALARIAEIAGAAAANGSYKHILFAPSYATRADQTFLFDMYKAVLDAGATVLGFSDSLGDATPEIVSDVVGRMRETGGGVRVHMHNDYGLALANTIAGIRAGANWADVSVNGLGERAGNCSLDEAALALERLYGAPTGIDLSALYSLSRFVADRSGVPVSPLKPVVGDNCFTNKLDIHVKAAISDPSLMEPFAPELVGNRRRIDLGRRSGPVATQHKARELGIELTDSEASAVADLVNRRATELKRSIHDDELVALVGETRGA